VDPLVTIVGIATFAALIFLFAGDEHLRGNVDVGPGSLACDFDTVGEGGRGGLRPAGAAVLGDVLVLDVG
jgi:hypothetical protein